MQELTVDMLQQSTCETLYPAELYFCLIKEIQSWIKSIPFGTGPRTNLLFIDFST